MTDDGVGGKEVCGITLDLMANCYSKYLMEEAAKERKTRMDIMRQNLKTSAIIKRVTLPLENKLERSRVRRKSGTSETPLLEKSFAESESQSDQQETTDFNTQYRMGDKLGEGAHGMVHKCYLKSTGDLFAVKTMVLDQEHMLYLKENFLYIKQLKHKHIVSYKAIFFEVKTDKCMLVMDYLPFPDLLAQPLANEEELKVAVHQLTQTLNYIHTQNICHRDVKPENVLYDQHNHTVTLVDFGISRKLTKRNLKRDMLTLTGTPYYRAPQMFLGGGYNELVDMWALGVTVFKLMTGVTPFESEYHSDTIENIMKGSFTFPPETEARFSKQARMFVGRLLKPKDERLKAAEALKDLWFIDLERQAQENAHARSVSVHKMGKKKTSDKEKLEVSESQNVDSLWKTHTGKEESEFVHMTRQDVMRNLKDLPDVEQEESMVCVFGIEVHSPTDKSTST